jgi:aspartate racemase
MRTIGILGGMTYHSTILYYSQINAHVQRTKGGVNAASLILHSFNFANISALFAGNQWDAVASNFIDTAKHMKAAGAGAIAIGCNIGHKVAEKVEDGVGLPVLHIAEFTAQSVREKNLKKVGLLATKAAMDGDFISGPLSERAGVEVLVPAVEDRASIDAAIFQELALGSVSAETKSLMERVVHELVDQGAEGVVLACTDLQFVLKPENVSVPLFDTLELHAKGLAEWAIRD